MDTSVSETNRLYGKTFSFMALATLTSLIVGYLVIRFVPAIMLIKSIRHTCYFSDRKDRIR